MACWAILPPRLTSEPPPRESTTRGQPRWLPRSCCSSSASGRTALSAGLLRVHARSYIHAPSPRAVPVLGQPVQIPCHAGWLSHLRWALVTTVVLCALPAHNTYGVRSRVSLQVVTRPSQADCPWLACYRMRSSTWAVVVFPDCSPLLVASCSRTARRRPIYEGERCSLMHQRGGRTWPYRASPPSNNKLSSRLLTS